jgi:threonine/homoserine/homoserine lactone efflux protein
MLSAYLVAAGALLVLTVLPGPDVAIVSRYSFSLGRSAGTRAALGIVAGLSVWGMLSLGGVVALLAAAPGVFLILKLAGAAYLLMLGMRLIWSSRHARKPGPAGDAAGRPAQSPERAGLLTNLLNPKIAVFYSTVLPELIPSSGPARLWMLVLATTHVTLSLAWLMCCALLFSRRRRDPLRRPLRGWADRVAGLTLIGFGVRVAIAR